MNRTFIKFFGPAGTFVGFFFFWLGAGWFGALEHNIFPSVPEVISGLREGLEKGYLWNDFRVSMSHTIPGIIAGTSVGIAFGILTGNSRIAEATLGTAFHFWRALPLVAMVPLLIKLIGIGWFSKVFIIGCGQFAPTWIATHIGVSSVPAKYLELAQAFSLSPFRLFRDVILPFSVPYIVSGVRTGVGVAYIMLFISEWIVSNAGIGYRLGIGHLVSRGDLMIIGLLQLGLLAYISDVLVRGAAALLFPWISVKHA